MRVRNYNRLNLTVGDRLEIRQRILPGVFRVHSAIEQKPMAANLKIVGIRADLRAPSEICEFQGCSSCSSESSFRLRLSGRGREEVQRTSSKIRSQLSRRIFSICSSWNPRSINLRVRLRACEWFLKSGMKCGVVNFAASSFCLDSGQWP